MKSFNDWFQHSKVIDQQGNPLICYHGTYFDFDHFRPGSHFGDQAAANERIIDISIDMLDDDHARILPVYLCIKNPLLVYDHGEFSTAKQLTEAAAYVGAISSSEAKLILGTRTEFERNIKARLFTVLFEKGFDGMMYTNTEEGNGISWMIFSSNQVRSIFDIF